MRRYFLISASLSLGYGSIYTLLADLRDRYGFSEGQLGVIAGAGFFAGFFAQVFLSRQADRGHAPAMVRGGVGVAALAMLGCALATQFWMFVLARILLGLGSGTVSPAIRRIVIVREPANLGVNLGSQAAWDMAGFVAGPIATAGIAQVLGLRAPFAVLAGLFGLILVASLRLDLHAGVASLERKVVRGLLRNRSLLATLAASIAFFTTVGVFEASWAVLLRDRGAETWLIGVTLSLFTLPMIYFAPIGGRAAQRVGPMRVVSMSIGVAIACTFSYGVLPSLWLLLIVSIVHAVADSYTMPGNQVAVALAAPESQVASALGLLGATGLATAGLVGLAAGSVYQHAGRTVLFTATAGMMSLFLVIARVLGRELLVPAAEAAPVIG